MTRTGVFMNSRKCSLSPSGDEHVPQNDTLHNQYQLSSEMLGKAR